MSRSLRLSWILFALTLFGCGHTKVNSNPSMGDPFDGLPGARDVSVYSSYQFREKGISRVEGALAASSHLQSPISRLYLARGLVDAMLYGELAQDVALLDGLVEKDFWLALERLLADDQSMGQALSEAYADGRSLVEALRERKMDRGYHETLSRLSRGKSMWATEAILARLLDLDELLELLAEEPLTSRGALFMATLGAQLCEGSLSGPQNSAQGWDLSCAPECRAAAGGHSAVSVAACGYAETGWPTDSDERLWAAEVMMVGRVLREVFPALRQLLAGRHPLALSCEPELEMLGTRMLSRPILLPWYLGGSDSPWLNLAQVPTTNSEAWERGGVTLALLDGALRVGVLPILATDTEGLSLRGSKRGFGVPGRALVSLNELETLTKAKDFDELSGSFAEALSLASGMVSAVSSKPEGIDVVVGAGERLARVMPALEMARQGHGGLLLLRFVVHDKGRQKVKALRLRLVGSVSNDSALDGFHEDVRPAELRAVITRDAVVLKVTDRVMMSVDFGERGFDPERLAKAIGVVRKQRPLVNSVTIEVEKDASRVPFSILAQVASSVLLSGLTQMVLLSR